MEVDQDSWDRDHNPWNVIFPGCEFEDSVLQVRPDLILWHRVRDKSVLFKEHQQRDPKVQKLIRHLNAATCDIACTPCAHSSGCPRRHWCFSKCGVLLRVTDCKPEPVHSESLGRMLQLRDTPCSCSPPEVCQHSQWAIRSGVAQDATGKNPDLNNQMLEDLPVSVSDRLCRRRRRVVVPRSLVESVLYHCHGQGVAGHPGSTRTAARVTGRFWWHGMYRAVRRWVKACLCCQRRKPCKPHNVVRPGVMEPTVKPMSTLFIDFSGPYPKTKRHNWWILSIICASTKAPVCVPLPNRTANLVVWALLEHVVQHYSCPQLIIMDRAREFLGDVLRDFCRVFGIQKAHTPAYTPTLRPYIERFMAWQAACMTIITPRFKDSWDLVLPLVSLSYRTTVTSNTGFSPYNLLFAREPHMPFDVHLDPWMADAPESKGEYVANMRQVLTDISSAVRDAHTAYTAKSLEARRGVYRKVEHHVGDFVLLWSPKTAEVLPKSIMDKPKLKDRWSLPMRIIAKNGPDSYILRNSAGGLVDARADLLTTYQFYYDGLPSVPSRPRFSKDERRALNKDSKTYIPPPIQQGSMVVFPLTMRNGLPGFGVGKATRQSPDGTWNLHWFSNTHEDLLGPFRPCYRTSTLSQPLQWYAAERRQASHQPFTTEHFYPGVISQRDAADVGFRLLPDGRLPPRVLSHIQSHPRYEWKAPVELEAEES